MLSQLLLPNSLDTSTLQLEESPLHLFAEVLNASKVRTHVLFKETPTPHRLAFFGGKKHKKTLLLLLAHKKQEGGEVIADFQDLFCAVFM